MSIIDFIKMHGLGNDFVIIDNRIMNVALTEQQIKFMADRRIGVGCDQVIFIEQGNSNNVNCRMSIFNADGTRAEACGNAARCVAWLIMKETKQDQVYIAVSDKILHATKKYSNIIAINMGVAKFKWQEIPLAKPVLELKMKGLNYYNILAVNMGNPHVVFFVENVDDVELSIIGPQIEHLPIFPQQINVNFAQILNMNNIKHRVWERGTGETLACGSGACAVVAASTKLGLTAHDVTVKLIKGDLQVKLLNDNSLLMSGPAEVSFTGILNLSD